ncbi:MAG: nitrate/nitrite transporter NrtS [Cyanobacteria bacterium J06607_6]
MKKPNLWGYLAALKDPTLRPMAIQVALVVGTILFLINHGAALMQGKMTLGRWASALLTYGVPYAVNIHGQYVMQQRQ